MFLFLASVAAGYAQMPATLRADGGIGLASHSRYHNQHGNGRHESQTRGSKGAVGV